MKVGDLVRVTTECFTTDYIGDIGIITGLRAFSDCKTVVEVTILFYTGSDEGSKRNELGGGPKD